MAAEEREKFAHGRVDSSEKANSEEKCGNEERECLNYHAPFGDKNFIGSCDAFHTLAETTRAIAARKSSVIIQGDTGTGKEMVARQIHKHSDRRDKPFVPVDCTTLTGQLFESQLFGHVKGAFTGAISDTLGFFRAADGGTVFLDEISEIPLEMQAKLLRVIQEEKVTPVGATSPYGVDVRIVCATNRNLQEMVKDGKFRDDLYYRLNVVTLQIPPLRERREDILLLARHFLDNQSSFYNEPLKELDGRAEEILLKYHWPGNVRELANAMERAYILSNGGKITADVLPQEILMADYTGGGNGSLPTLDEVKKKLIKQALEMTGGKKIAAAKILGVERRKLNRMIESLGVEVDAIKKNSA
jgi:transcriptional regulator with PAS, ATPase and Fis domain